MELIPRRDVGDRSRATRALLWLLRGSFAVWAAFAILASFMSAVGWAFLIAGIVSAAIAWRIPFGERPVWFAAVLVAVASPLGLAIHDWMLLRYVPPADYAVGGVAAVVLILLFVPPVRRHFAD